MVYTVIQGPSARALPRGAHRGEYGDVLATTLGIELEEVYGIDSPWSNQNRAGYCQILQKAVAMHAARKVHAQRNLAFEIPPVASKIILREHMMQQVRCNCSLGDVEEDKIPEHYTIHTLKSVAPAVQPMAIELVPKTLSHGQVHLSGVATAFNHASCQCITMATCNGAEDVHVWAAVRDLEYAIDRVRSTITISHTPLVVL
eukprot:m.16517 g.16517  ORF g.16517 m.16517 type:complete len:202 (-) comp5057_c0_seq1:302-907(-)